MIRISNIFFFRFYWKNGKLDWPKCTRTVRVSESRCISLGRWQLAIRTYLHITKDYNFFIFGDRLRHVFKPLLLYFDLCNADTPSTGDTQQPYCASLGSRFLQVRDNQI